MMDMEYNRTSPFISNCLHYSSEFHPYVGEFTYLCCHSRNDFIPPVKTGIKSTKNPLPGIAKQGYFYIGIKGVGLF